MDNRIENKINIYKDAVLNFKESLEIDLTEYSDIVTDSIKSGRVQKYEFCVELLWKIIKLYIYEINGIDAKSPKSAIKEFYNTGYISSDEYEKIIQMIDDRNELSHIYKKDEFDRIYNRIITTLPLFLKIDKLLSSK